MNTHKPSDMVCPFCQGDVARIIEVRRPTGLTEKVGRILFADILFWFVTALVLAISFWSFIAGFLLFVLVASAWLWWQPRNAIYRCNACQSVLTYSEVKRVHTLELQVV